MGIRDLIDRTTDKFKEMQENAERKQAERADKEAERLDKEAILLKKKALVAAKKRRNQRLRDQINKRSGGGGSQPGHSFEESEFGKML